MEVVKILCSMTSCAFFMVAALKAGNQRGGGGVIISVPVAICLTDDITRCYQ